MTWSRGQIDSYLTVTPNSDISRVVFEFEIPKNAFGIDICDFGDNGEATLTISNNNGDILIIDLSPNANDELQFLGVITEMKFTTAIFQIDVD